MKTISGIRALTVAFALGLAGSTAQAEPQFFDALTNLYPGIISTRLTIGNTTCDPFTNISCLVCHTVQMPECSSDLSVNSYGAAFSNQLFTVLGGNATSAKSVLQQALINIQSQQSDADGYDNLTELTNLSFPGNTADIPMKIHVTAPADYGDVPVGASLVKNLDIRNDGSVDLHVGALSFATDPDFSCTANCPALTVTPGATVHVSIKYQPSAVGQDSLTLSVPSDDPKTPTVLVSLTGNGVTPPTACTVFVSPLPVDYPDTLVGDTAPQTISLHNAGALTCTVTSVSITTGNTDFFLVPVVTSFTLASNETKQIEVDFTPSDVGARAGTLRVVSTDGNHDVPLAGAGLKGCTLNVSTPVVDFGAVRKEFTRALNVTVSNSGSVDCQVTGIALDTPSVKSLAIFAFEPGPPGLPLTVPKGDSIQLRVGYTPRTIGADTGTLTLTTSDAAHPTFVIPLTGTSDIHNLAVTQITAPKRVVLSAAKPTATPLIRVQIQNRGLHDETIADLGVLSNLVTLAVHSLSNACPDLVPVLLGAAPQATPPIKLAPKQKLTVFFNVTFNAACVDPVATTKKAVHDDYSYVVTLKNSAVGGQDVIAPDDTVCPRTGSPPNVIDLSPHGRIIDKGCGTKPPHGSLGAPVVTDVIVK